MTFSSLHPVIQALLAGCFTWSITALGAATVFPFRNVSRKVLDVMLGFAAGVMIAASFFSLLLPSIEMSKAAGKIAWIPAVVGFLCGGLFLRLIDQFLPHLHLGLPASSAEGIKTSWQRSILLVLAITLHNIPEGLAVGVAFGALSLHLPSATYGAAIALAIGIGIQNFPEGAAVSIPLRREGFSTQKAFFYGQASGVVEPLAAVIGAATILFMQPILPYALSFAAGAMIFVVVEELIPESQSGGNPDLVTLAAMGGFAVMMFLDVALG